MLLLLLLLLLLLQWHMHADYPSLSCLPDTLTHMLKEKLLLPLLLLLLVLAHARRLPIAQLPARYIITPHSADST
jgi:hypothetical protein